MLEEINIDRLVEFVTNHLILAGGLVVVTFLLLQDIIETTFRKYKTTTALHTVTMLDDDHTTILDVREITEFGRGHIENALHVPVAKIDERMPELVSHKNDPLIVMCQTGTRSPAVCRKLQKHGFENIFLLTGGMQAWEDNNLPIRRKKKR